MRRSALVLLPVIALLCGLAMLWNRAEKEEPPNIVLIIIDALRADLLHCYGFPRQFSTELDQIAAEGVLFESVLAQCSWTRPSIASMLTSQYPRTIGIYKEQWDVLDDRFVTLAEVLHSEGYHTFGITANPNINSYFNFHQGFDEYADSTTVYDWMIDEAESAETKTVESLTAPEIFAMVLERARMRGRPTYVQLNVMEVHTPSLLRDEYRNRFGETYEANYAAALAQISHDIDTFIRELSALPGWSGNTLFVITSDHGEGLNSHVGVEESSFHGNLLYESQLRIPLIFHHPGKEEGGLVTGRIPDRVRLLDLMPTILDYAGVEPPSSLEGRSLLPFLQGDPTGVGLPAHFIAETSWRDVDKVGLYTDQWKYIENRDGWGGVNPRELQPFGILERGTKTDAIGEHAEAARRMEEILAGWEASHRKAPAKQPTAEFDPKMLEQLKAVGYAE